MLMLQVTGEEEIEEDNGDGDELREDFVAPDNVDGLYQKRGRSANSQDCAFNKTGTSTSKKRKGTSSTPGVAEVLTEMLLENRNRDREMERKLEESATRQPDEREAWGNWLQTVVRNCPKEKFRQFQTETLALSQRYLPTDEGQSQQCPGPSTMFSPQPAASHFQAHGQFQHPSLQFQSQPHVYYQQQQMQEPGYMRRPTFTQLQPTQQHQQQQQPQHQPTRPTSAPTPVGTSNIIASSYQIANTNDGDQDLTPPLRAPSSGERLSLPGFNVGSFGIHGANRDQPESDAD
ncbi:putative cyclin-dependent serine/threonine-protein kinase DDB_G0272797/DDB_G0274007 [Lytechinus variegatus]|uniref:putative cyclin-dependent serine/threonine-protein kinase DDB_G0272797/DDB_G0274007 n=1 Tax=Lytechinus variegatus TaxID=7654 RepID=UPI001BB0F455|nr:putative cyclin-dependent serine/threonine-protein kinase DDB_G0272797/DDB_G0274007 [Lytechinus variegatus]